MMDWTDRHCRMFHRTLSRQARLYTEMVTTGALVHGDVARHLDFEPSEHPVALQLGGSVPGDLAQAARLGAQWGYDEINLNCGCPSDRVQNGAFGACLMKDAPRVAAGVAAMCDAVDRPVSVKHRIGVDEQDGYGPLRDFVGTVAAEGGVRVFILHMRKAWLRGLSPKENRSVPPLRPDLARRLRADFPDLTLVVNGEISTLDQAAGWCDEGFDGVMLGRAAYQEPWLLAAVDRRLFGADRPPPDRWAVAAAMADYAETAMARGAPLSAITRHMMGLFNGLPGARRWRRILSEDARGADAALILRAADQVRALAA